MCRAVWLKRARRKRRNREIYMQFHLRGNMGKGTPFPGSLILSLKGSLGMQTIGRGDAEILTRDWKLSGPLPYIHWPIKYRYPNVYAPHVSNATRSRSSTPAGQATILL
ncbi:uncharacterized protein H6S33_001662 [Morchella sextelata]|uniref:uncharacterized protein n=1 Tax=Morchella sextelata TaxID=1174677 RepID=UPI001D051505|nr:uncharacterized protein H6S33_001662 [Morchella sextelata]KAH0608528.1 hypothetical protein H6S33_001662 [Morchella sextelata]